MENKPSSSTGPKPTATRHDSKVDSLATASLIIGTALLCVLLLAAPKSSAPDDGHGHGGGKEEKHDEHESPGIEIDDEDLESAGMIIEEAVAINIVPKVTTRGQITENSNQAMNVKPRFGGIVKSVLKDFGDTVKKGDILLSIESASTRAAYTVRSTLNGIVADKKVVAGSFVPEGESIMRVVDLSTVWFQGKVPVADAKKLRSGRTAKINDRILGIGSEGKVIYVSPIVEEDTQTCDVRIEIANPENNWRVGSFADAEMLLDPVEVTLAVKSTAIQDLNGQSVVFTRDEDRLVLTNVQVGWSDGTWSEVLKGMSPGDKYLATNSFLAKAELMKSTAEHEH